MVHFTTDIVYTTYHLVGWFVGDTNYLMVHETAKIAYLANFRRFSHCTQHTIRLSCVLDSYNKIYVVR